MEDFSLLHTPTIFYQILGSEPDLQVFCGSKRPAVCVRTPVRGDGMCMGLKPGPSCIPRDRNIQCLLFLSSVTPLRVVWYVATCVKLFLGQ